jgi:hypothetical protein
VSGCRSRLGRLLTDPRSRGRRRRRDNWGDTPGHETGGDGPRETWPGQATHPSADLALRRKPLRSENTIFGESFRADAHEVSDPPGGELQQVDGFDSAP